MNIYDRIACETNSYAELVQREKGDRWSNTSLPESCAFTWLNILMGDSLHYSYEEYWRDNDLLGSPVFKNIMTYSRYEKLSQYIHLNAAAARERPDNANYNPVTKVKPFYDVTNQNFWRYYQHSTEISIDKAMKRVHRKTWASPEKFGINFWARCDCRTSYMYMFQLYTGNVTGPPPPAHSAPIRPWIQSCAWPNSWTSWTKSPCLPWQVLHWMVLATDLLLGDIYNSVLH